ncbi:MAG: hypothetical protein H6739_16710 [Alphaproteobacteria bacterium]|nr:hypothetical protein [Alphaproteobacteria bacterium]
MEFTGLEGKMVALLEGVNLIGGYPMSLVCTDQGLLVASSGEQVRSEIVGGLTSLFNDIVSRAQRDLEFERVDELTLTNADAMRYVIRPLPISSDPRLFLVVQVPKNKSWRQHTNLLVKRLVAQLEPLVTPISADEAEG